MPPKVKQRKDAVQRDPELRDAVIQVGDSVLIQLTSGDIRSVKLDPNSTATINKFGSFHANELIGQSYGITYEIQGKKLRALPPRTLQEVEDTDATNEYINDGEFVQPLTIAEIQALKQTGVHASDIIKKQIEQHSNYSLKTEYSKEKYKKRKEAKYFKTFTTLAPTLHNVCEYWFLKDQARLRDIRMDTLSQLLNLGGVRPGGRYIVVDDASGVVVSAMLERMGGEGRIITIHDSESPPPYPVMTNMNFSSEVTHIMSSLNWATADESYAPILPSSEVATQDVKSERQKSRLNKRKAMTNHLHSTRQELFDGEFDGLILATQYDPYSIIEKYAQYLGGSANLVAYSPHPQILADLQTKLRNIPEWLSPSLTESWLRRYQVLPGRTHPLMNMSGSGGYLLHAIRVYAAPISYFLVS
ncbi:Gcd10p-domain-containing protein [Macrolepiota fuliginosa MF-IS2]|uniref:tRNA (adenine(58)-N(1))-methyltransferase non-catalytic subunit TRM6 n=1 Tax=Macrolepiota fuliginosa MF-IS2 TaxID=1400762 RepID=A0A9P6C6M8_9AGAR|nr:Gcd10p-domain-containing protein [Macrolepiota fuliginosa MF-IS2]